MMEMKYIKAAMACPLLVCYQDGFSGSIKVLDSSLQSKLRITASRSGRKGSARPGHKAAIRCK
ncbi:uncharacterized protein LOC105196935 [Solenopsis invicta]|uniref:uncharacterized protein LOC105196935 n=1 Tax=Solenopsis invicta TaxID=13686 RepID=UPI00193D1050|nr:uncharacterized protein LOC105196935 [Solenopsis invicta]